MKRGQTYDTYAVNKIGKQYSWEYNDIPKVFFTPHPVGHSYPDVI
jgi:hypothetical protein